MKTVTRAELDLWVGDGSVLGVAQSLLTVELFSTIRVQRFFAAVRRNKTFDKDAFPSLQSRCQPRSQELLDIPAGEYEFWRFSRLFLDQQKRLRNQRKNVSIDIESPALSLADDVLLTIEQ